ncbi:DUF3592 domain-containing protein [Dactylosporangium sp. NPDC005555]|uniref:DUF3592 domain-containing protein n=1 Tax=Dactylosporangium sp. NPDC005555 TaxID=3154889 RepID=UPI0033AE6397
MATKRGRRRMRQRLRGKRTPRMANRHGGEPREPYGFTAWLGTVMLLVLGAAMLQSGIEHFRTHADLHADGVPATAEILRVDRGRTGESVRVRFTTGAGDVFTADVDDPPSDIRIAEGAPIDIRYDPRNPSRAVPVGDDQAVLSRWFRTVVGAALIGLSGWAAWRAPRRPRHRDR